MNLFIKLAIDLLALGKTYPTFLTDKKAVQSFMDRLSPADTGKELIR